MKYMLTKSTHPIYGEGFTITKSNNEENFTSFPAEVGNSNYDAFLVDTNLTDKKVKALTPDKWYDFPKETKK